MIKREPARGSRSRLQQGSSEENASVGGANAAEAAGDAWWERGGSAEPPDGDAHCGGISLA